VIVAHVLGLPVEESVLQLAPAGAAIVTAVTIAVRTSLDRLRLSGRLRKARRGRVSPSGVDRISG
jgi:hypothetical protein